MWADKRESFRGNPKRVEEVAGSWKESPRAYYRENAAFTRTFSMIESPAKIFNDRVSRTKLANLGQLSDEMATIKCVRRSGLNLAIIDVGILRATF
ncbi:MAG: hypothetical protein HKL84_09545 [Acidimicrobiaceae bacterium]|nr:hypothetical protein [Acidimicrobiaceae bacterium]